ncbi:hypothetical protein [Demequina rhizosphaerae]|uniref:hypothetical protein n=1 Tax=Demequina rhizosphaerae TaxID=1638985 RepID=UPI000B21A5CB|nr:hypothetical protein [Demequina rhizosphaerae]
MRRTARLAAAVVIGIVLASGVSACDSLPDIDPSRLPDISLPARPSDSAEPQPTETVTEEPAPAETVTEEPAPSPSAEPGAAEEVAPFVWWPWAVAAAVLIVLLIVWWRWWAKRRAWDRRLEATRAELSWVEDSVVPQVLSKPTAAEAASQWSSARPRILDLDRELHELADSAPSENRTSDSQQGLAVLRALATAVDAEASTQADNSADALRARRAELDAARAQARAWIAAKKS